MALSGQDVLFTDVIERLRAAAHEDRAIDAAQVHLINLPEIIQNAGAHWPLIKDKIRLGSLRYLKACLGDADIVIPAGDGFLIIFAQGSVEELKARTGELRALLLEFYLGQQAPVRDLQVSVEHRRVGAREIGALIAPQLKPVAAQPCADFCVFAPVWSPGRQVIASYFCAPMRREKSGVRYGYDRGYAEAGRHAKRDYAELDLAMLGIVDSALARYEGGDAQPALGVSVHATTMQNRDARAAFLERLSRLPPELMKHLYLKIAEIETGAPLIHLADWAGMLRARVRMILLEFHHSEAPPNLAEVGVWGAGFMLTASASGAVQEADLAPYARQFRRWGESLGRQKKRLFVDNLRSVTLVRLAAEAGADFITSDAFWPPQKWPGQVVSAPAPGLAPFSQPQKTLSSG